MSVDLSKVAEHLGVEKEAEVQVEEKRTPAGKITQASVTCRISPKNTYSSAEVSKTVDIYTSERAVVDGVINQLKDEVVKDTLDVADRLLMAAHDKGML